MGTTTAVKRRYAIEVTGGLLVREARILIEVACPHRAGDGCDDCFQAAEARGAELAARLDGSAYLDAVQELA